VDAAALAVALGEGDVDEPVLGVVHVDRALGHPVLTIARAATHAVAVDRLDPVVVLDPDLSASRSDIQIVWPPRDSDSMKRLSWYSEWIDHLLCGVR
jgi:hypothetical protein